ncbi:MAG: hypothetical protein KIT24_10645 [Phycisphaeraceae bacterium]|nr:hypothetical protein [Phycisphaeraceae bacterium]
MRKFLLACAAGALFTGMATAQPLVTLADGNSEADFDLSGGGQYNWFVDGVDHLFNQDFYFRAGGMMDERSVTTTALMGHHVVDTNPFSDPRPDVLTTLYFDAATGLEFEFRYGLSGGTPGSRTADLAEQITIRNRGQQAIDVSFFQYVDFDLAGTAGSDFGEILNGRVAQQSDTTSGVTVTETVVTPAPSHFDIKNWPDIISLFFDGLPTTLSDDPGPVFGDVAWAFQWNFTLVPGGSYLISKDKLIVPAPGAVALLGFAGLAASRRRRA